jgi:hypothetical protein
LGGNKHSYWLLVGLFMAAWVPDMGARADGDDFFIPEEVAGKPEYVVFGSVKDDRGNYISAAVVTVEVEEPVLIYEATTNILGRFRTVDVGRAISDLGYDVDPSRIKVSVSAPGYVLMRRLNRNSPRRTHGAVEIDFLMKKE